MRWRQINDRKTRAPSSGSELRIPNAAAQTRVVSMAGIRLGSWKSARAFKGMICVDISEFESHMPSHAVGLSQVRNPTGNLRAPVEIIARAARHLRDAVRLEAEVALFRDRRRDSP
jgi:hypothetical protein